MSGGGPRSTSGMQRRVASSALASFQEKLQEGQTTSSWLDEQLAAPSPSNPSKPLSLSPPVHTAAAAAAQPKDRATSKAAVESATTQIVNRALRMLKKDPNRRPAPGDANPQGPPDSMLLSKV